MYTSYLTEYSPGLMFSEVKPWCDPVVKFRLECHAVPMLVGVLARAWVEGVSDGRLSRVLSALMLI